VRYAGIFALAALAGCSGPSPEETRREAMRLRASVEKYRSDYLNAVAAENRLAPETLAWLNGPAITAGRTQAVSDARRFMDLWARVYFAPRHMHEQLRLDEYSSPRVRAAHEIMLNRLKRRYFELHDYQRYAQHASESEMHHTPAGRLPKQLEEFRNRLQTREPAADEIGPLLDSLQSTACRTPGAGKSR
jgi:hypothetical protein